MTTPYILFADLATEAPIPARGILSQTLSNEKDVEFLLFAFAAGEQLSEHTSARPAIIHILAGEGEPTRDLDGRHPLAQEGNGEEDAQERLEVPEDCRPRRSDPVDGGEVEQVRNNAGEDDRVGERAPTRESHPPEVLANERGERHREQEKASHDHLEGEDAPGAVTLHQGSDGERRGA